MSASLMKVILDSEANSLVAVHQIRTFALYEHVPVNVSIPIQRSIIKITFRTCQGLQILRDSSGVNSTMIMKANVLRFINLCSLLERYQYFRRNLLSPSSHFSTLKVKAAVYWICWP